LVNPGTIRSTYPTILKGIPCATTLIFFSYPSCIESGDNKFTREKRFFAEQIVPEITQFNNEKPVSKSKSKYDGLLDADDGKNI
jgi:hypothetical protein